MPKEKLFRNRSEFGQEYVSLRTKGYFEPLCIRYNRARNVRIVLFNDLFNVRNVLINVCNVSLMYVIFYLKLKICFIDIDQVWSSIQYLLNIVVPRKVVLTYIKGANLLQADF